MDEIVIHEGDNKDGAAIVAPNAQPTQANPEQQRKAIEDFMAQQWKAIGDKERLTIAKRRGLIKDADMKDDALVAAAIAEVELPGDNNKYIRVAQSRYGFLSFGKTHGRKKRHFTKHELAIKSASLRHFRVLFAAAAAHIEAELVSKGEPYVGLPEAILKELGAKAAILGAKEVLTASRDKRRRVRRQQSLSRGINRGLIRANAPAKTFVHSGGQYGR
jgi:hypothetical protein